jgi:acyl carrier protein
MALLFGCQDPENEPNLNERATAIMARFEENEGGRLEGVVRLFNKEKAYGFIEFKGNEDGTDRGIYFDYSAIAGTTYNKLKVGDLVNFKISVGETEPKARSVSIVTSDEELNAYRQAFAKEQAYIANYCSPDKENECTIRRIIAASLGTPFQKAMREAAYVDDLGADSLHIREIIMALEEEFDLEILDKDLELMPTVGDTIDYIARRKQESAKH